MVTKGHSLFNIWHAPQELSTDMKEAEEQMELLQHISSMPAPMSQLPSSRQMLAAGNQLLADASPTASVMSDGEWSMRLLAILSTCSLQACTRQRASCLL